MPIIQRISEQGSSVVLMGPEQSCEQIAEFFKEVKMTTTVRPKQEGDFPKPKGEYEGSEVQQLDAAAFKQALNGATPTLVAFSAPWCGHCKTMVPEFKAAAKNLLRAGVAVGAVDCDANKEVAQMMGIRGYPTVAFVANGKSTIYQGPRTSQAFSDFARQQATVAKLKAAVSGVAAGVVSGAKAGLSKLGLSKIARSNFAPAPAT